MRTQNQIRLKREFVCYRMLLNTLFTNETLKHSKYLAQWWAGIYICNFTALKFAVVQIRRLKYNLLFYTHDIHSFILFCNGRTSVHVSNCSHYCLRIQTDFMNETVFPSSYRHKTKLDIYFKEAIPFEYLIIRYTEAFIYKAKWTKIIGMKWVNRKFKNDKIRKDKYWKGDEKGFKINNNKSNPISTKCFRNVMNKSSERQTFWKCWIFTRV